VTPEDVARANQFRDGFELVDYAEVGLPVFRLTLEAFTTTMRAIPAIQEFTMRCLSLGETREADIARMLGLKPDIVEGAMNVLVGDGLVSRVASPEGLDTFRLTEIGEERLAQELLEVVREESLVVDFDGIRRTPIRLAGENVVRAAELKNVGAVEIRPYPAEPPAVGELAIPEVTRAIRREGGDDFNRTVLGLRRIVRRNNVFRDAVALVYAPVKGEEIQVGFAIGGKLSDSHERAFAWHGGPKKMGFVRTVAGDQPRRRLDRLLGRDIVRDCAGDDQVLAARQEEASAVAEVQAVLPAASAGGRASGPARALAAAEERLAVARHVLVRMPLRPLACFEQDDLLFEALRGASRELLVTSAGLQPTLLNGYVLREVDRLISDGVAQRFTSYLAPQLEPRGGDRYDPLSELAKRASNGRLQLIQAPRGEFHYLVQDDRLAVITTRPFFGDVVRRSGFSRVAGYVAREPRIVEQIRALAERSTVPRKRA
jgi:DNA-binding MarR family transcriptional regulator